MRPVVSTVDRALAAIRDGYRAQLAAVSALGGRVFWLQSPEQPQMPCVVVQSQDGGGAELPFIGSVAWSGDITVRVFATTLTEVESLAAAIRTAIPEVFTVSGVAVTSRLRRPLVAPPAKATHTAGWIYRVIVSQGG